MSHDEMIAKFEREIRGGHRTMVPVVRKFLKFAESDFSREKIQAYLKKLEKDGYAPGTIFSHFNYIRRFCRVNGMDWPFRWGEGPRVAERDVYQPALDPALVITAIQAAREGRLDTTEAAWLALSTTYGLRRVELQNLAPQDLDLKGGTIYIETAKHGRQRYHLLPGEIAGVLADYRFPQLSQFQASKVWYRIEEKVGLPRLPEVGWHAIRRILNTMLLDEGLPMIVVMDFLRWKHSSNIMPARYYSTTIVGTEGAVVGIEKGMQDVDRRIFAVHPFLSEWRK